MACQSVYFRAVGILAIIVPVRYTENPLQWGPSGGVYFTQLSFSLPEGYFLDEPCLGWGGVRNNAFWPGSVTFNGAEGSAIFFASDQSRQPYELNVYVKARTAAA